MYKQICECVSAVRSVKEAKQKIFVDARFFGKNDLWQYVEISDQRLCPVCRDNGSIGTFRGTHLRAQFPYLQILDVNTIKANEHPNCFVAGTLVWTSKGLVPIEDVYYGDRVLTHKGRFRQVINIHRNKHFGKLVTINDVTATPNHRFLTSEGWQRLDCLDDTHQIFAFKSNDTPAETCKKGRFHRILSFLFGRIMPVSTVNFNRYLRFWKRKVNVKFADGKPRNNVDSAILKRFKKRLFQFRRFKVSLHSFCSDTQRLVCFSGTANFIVTRFNLMFSLLRRHLFPLQSFSFRLTADVNSQFNESTPYYSSVNIESFRKNVFAHSSHVKPSNLSVRQNTSFHLHTPTITRNNNIFNGYVYNLSVAQDESYTVGESGMAVHNCRCVMVRIHRVKLT